MCNISFNTNLKKALEVILYLSNRIDGVTFHTLLKLLFFADIYHLNKYGRPIIGDEYVAMQYGPVASNVYNILKHDDFIIEALPEVPFETEKIKKDDRVVKAVIPLRDYNPDELSISDEEALDYSINTYKDCDFEKLTEISHKHPAWENAWKRRGCSGNPPIHYTDMINPENIELIKELEETSRTMCI